MKLRLFIVILLALFTTSTPAASRNILWDKVDNQCQLAYEHNNNYAPCALVDKHEGYVLYKTDFDPNQYLLLPIKKITGVEDPQLLSDNIPNYFWLAWQARMLLTEKVAQKAPESAISLTVNPLNSRSQDQLHIHISCLKPAVYAALQRLDPSMVGNGWYPFPALLADRGYLFKKISRDDLRENNIFQLVSEQVHKDGLQMAYTTIAVVNLDKDNFLLLQATGNDDHIIAAETLQDHSCAVGQTG